MTSKDCYWCNKNSPVRAWGLHFCKDCDEIRFKFFSNSFDSDEVYPNLVLKVVYQIKEEKICNFKVPYELFSKDDFVNNNLKESKMKYLERDPILYEYEKVPMKIKEVKLIGNF